MAHETGRLGAFGLGADRRRGDPGVRPENRVRCAIRLVTANIQVGSTLTAHTSEEIDMSRELAAIHALVPAAAQTRIRIALSAVAIVTAVLGGVLSYHAGELHARQVTVLSGNAYVGAHQAAVRCAGWTYGVSDGVTWIDGIGSVHDTGWPGCLSTPGTTAPIKFGEVQVTAPHGDSWRQVGWVGCRS